MKWVFIMHKKDNMSTEIDAYDVFMTINDHC